MRLKKFFEKIDQKTVATLENGKILQRKLDSLVNPAPDNPATNNTSNKDKAPTEPGSNGGP